MIFDLLTCIGKLFTGEVTTGDFGVNLYVIFMDHGITISLSIVAIRALLSKNTDKSTQISTGILALSYVLSSLYFYFFNFMIDEGFTDFSLYLSYTFLDSLTVLCVIFAHAFYRMKFSFSANLVCYMVLINSHLQFFLTIVVFLASNQVIESDTLYNALGGFYSLSINLVCWVSAMALLMPIKVQKTIERVRLAFKRNKATSQ